MALLDSIVRARREQLGLSQAQMAERLGVTLATVCRWENGEAIPPPKRLAQLAHTLDLDLDHMLGYGGYLSNVVYAPRGSSSSPLRYRIDDLPVDGLGLEGHEPLGEIRGRFATSAETESEEPPQGRTTPSVPS